MGCMTERSGLDSERGNHIFPFFITFRTALGPTRPRHRWGEGKAGGTWSLSTHLHLVPRLRIVTLHLHFIAWGLIMPRDNFTFNFMVQYRLWGICTYWRAKKNSSLTWISKVHYNVCESPSLDCTNILCQLNPFHSFTTSSLLRSVFKSFLLYAQGSQPTLHFLFSWVLNDKPISFFYLTTLTMLDGPFWAILRVFIFHIRSLSFRIIQGLHVLYCRSVMLLIEHLTNDKSMKLQAVRFICGLNAAQATDFTHWGGTIAESRSSDKLLCWR
jgi:hypothetical protein